MNDFLGSGKTQGQAQEETDWPYSPQKLLTDPQTFFRRYLYRNYYSFALLAERVQRRVTPAGWLVIAGAVVAGALGADTTASFCYQTFAVTGCVLLLSLFCTPLGRPRLKLRRLLPKFGAVGERLRYRILVQNMGRKREAALRLIEELPDPRPTFAEFASIPEPGEEKRNWLDRTYGYYRWRWLMARNRRARMTENAVPPLAAGMEISLDAEMTPLRRGVLRLTGMTVACPDPFGLFRSLRTHAAEATVLILPRRYVLPRFELPGLTKYQMGGVSMASTVGESDEFVSLREYRAGDPLRRLHWKSFAKLGKPIVKEFQDEFFIRHALILDTFGGGNQTENFEEAVSVAASLAFTVEEQDSVLDLMFVGAKAFCFTSGRGVAHSEQVLEVLASVQLCPEKDFASLEGLVLGHAPDLSGCLCIFLGWDAPRQDLVRRLVAQDLPLRVFVITTDEVDLPLGPMRDQPQHFHVLPCGRVAEKLASL